MTMISPTNKEAWTCDVKQAFGRRGHSPSLPSEALCSASRKKLKSKSRLLEGARGAISYIGKPKQLATKPSCLVTVCAARGADWPDP